jgi:flagellar biosynthesis protein FlhG
MRAQLQQVLDRYVAAAAGAPVHLELLGEVPADPAVRQSVQRRQLMLELLPGAPAAMAVRELAARLPDHDGRAHAPQRA